MKITILTFNYGYAGMVVNGPGMCLANFVKFLRKHTDFEIDVYSYLKPNRKLASGVKDLRDNKSLSKSILQSDIVHLWSGITPSIIHAVKFANGLHKKVIIGPNVIDTVDKPRELQLLSGCNFDRLFAVNDRLKFKIALEYKIPVDKIDVFQVGPDPKLWSPSSGSDGTILWKGNGRQFVKDLDFAKKVAEELKEQYEFKFIGDKRPYDYFEHISEAKKSKLIIITSLSETMGLAMMEAWASGIPSISHPKIYMHGQNYQTGIITNKTVSDYATAIKEVMENQSLYDHLSQGCIDFISREFSSEIIASRYTELLSSIK
jgi:glycosyltransferase involved in cell wall biosynthesis